MDLRADLHIGPRQQQMLSPRLTQSLRILEAPVVELAQILAASLCANPFLEEEPPVEPLAESYEAVLAAAGGSAPGSNGGTRLPADRPGWRDRVLARLRLRTQGEKTQAAAEYLLGSLDPRGYLAVPLAEVAAATGLDEAAVEAVRAHLMRLDPPGLAARDLRECLMVQLEVKGALGGPAAAIVDGLLPELARRQYGKIASCLGATPDEVNRAVQTVRSLCPAPRRMVEAEHPVPVLPDLRVVRVGARYEVAVQDAWLPQIRYLPPPESIMRSPDLHVRRFARDQSTRARWLIESLAQRRRTLAAVMRRVLVDQRAFFEDGVHCLKPLIYRQLADPLGLHESTVARAVRGKFVQTPRGLFPVRFFFSQGLTTSLGDRRVPASVRQRMRELVAAEDRRSPLTDEHLTRMLRMEGLRISRRTVAKYRDQMRIPKASYRKEA